MTAPRKVSRGRSPGCGATPIKIRRGARDKGETFFTVDRDLLIRAPNLLIVSSNGAGFDPVDVESLQPPGGCGAA